MLAATATATGEGGLLSIRKQRRSLRGGKVKFQAGALEWPPLAAATALVASYLRLDSAYLGRAEPILLAASQAFGWLRCGSRRSNRHCHGRRRRMPLVPASAQTQNLRRRPFRRSPAAVASKPVVGTEGRERWARASLDR